MKTAFSFTAEARAAKGKGKARQTRRDNKIPAIIYGGSLKQPLAIALPDNALTLAYRKGSFMNKLVDITVDGTTYHALPRDIQLHPVSDKIEHADFLRVDAKAPVHVFVPVHFKNAERSVGIKRGGVLNIVRHEIEMVCTPDLIPDEIVIDISERNIGDSIHISHVVLPEGVRPAITSRDFTIATIAGRSADEDTETASTAAAPGADSVAAGEASTAGGDAKDK